MAKFEIEIPDEDVNTVKSALGRAGALLEWEGKTQKNAEKKERLTNEGAALLSLAMQFVFVEIEPEDVSGPSEESIEMQQIVDSKYIEGGYEEDHEGYETVQPAGGEPYVANDKWDGIRDHDNDHTD